MLGFLWHSSKWAHHFFCFLQYMSGLEVLACQICDYYAPTAPFLEPLSKVTATCRGKMQQLSGCILIDRYITLSFGVDAIAFHASHFRPFQERHAITWIHAYTCAKGFRSVINHMRKSNF